MRKLQFLTSNRFWALVLLSIAWYLGSIGILSQELVQAFMIVLGGHIGIRTIDRTAEQKNK